MPFSLPTSIAPGRWIVFLICLSLTVMLLTSPSTPGVEPLTHHNARFVPRQGPVSSSIQSSPEVSPTPTSTSTSQESVASQPSNPPNENTSTTSTTTESSTTPRQETSTTPPPQTQATPPPAQLSSIQSIGSDGAPTVVVVTVLATSTSTSSTPTPTPDEQSPDSGSSGLGTGSIIGLSVAGGIALLGIVAFFIWKFTRKRRSATYDDGEQRH